jgi:hypothetical protein
VATLLDDIPNTRKCYLRHDTAQASSSRQGSPLFIQKWLRLYTAFCSCKVMLRTRSILHMLSRAAVAQSV